MITLAQILDAQRKARELRAALDGVEVKDQDTIKVVWTPAVHQGKSHATLATPQTPTTAHETLARHQRAHGQPDALVRLAQACDDLVGHLLAIDHIPTGELNWLFKVGKRGVERWTCAMPYADTETNTITFSNLSAKRTLERAAMAYGLIEAGPLVLWTTPTVSVVAGDDVLPALLLAGAVSQTALQPLHKIKESVDFWAKQRWTRDGHTHTPPDRHTIEIGRHALESLWVHGPVAAA